VYPQQQALLLQQQVLALMQVLRRTSSTLS